MEYKKVKVPFEEWSMYEVDTNGIVYGQNGKPLKYSLNHNGYCIINFNHYDKRKGYAIHRLVAETFIPNPENKPTVNHIDGNKQNNSVENLEWSTYKEQTDHAKNILGYDNSGENNVKAKGVQGFDKKTKELKYDFNSLTDAALYLSEDKTSKHLKSVIWKALNGRSKSYKGCIWKYK